VGRGWAPADVADSFGEAIHELHLRVLRKVTCHFRDDHVEQWWAAELTFLGYGPGNPVRAICATTDRRTLLKLSTWCFTTNLPLEAAPLAEVMRLYWLRHWVKQGPYSLQTKQIGIIRKNLETSNKQNNFLRLQFFRHTLITVSINVSPRQFSNADVADLLVSALARHDVPAGLVELEITESSVMAEGATVSMMLAGLQEKGVKILVDDFGTGYSSLSQLQRLDFDVLKVDQSFTAALSRYAKVF
jgi:hypothetical protein